MKKMIITLLALAPLLTISAETRTLRYDSLPAKAKEFIRQNFADTAVSQVTVEDEPRDSEYTVVLRDGSKVEFDRYGDWTEVDCKYGCVPENVIPEKIREHIYEHFPDNFAVRIDKGWRKYEVLLDNRLELQFDKNGRFTRFDD